jgi:hypothetical protein
MLSINLSRPIVQRADYKPTCASGEWRDARRFTFGCRVNGAIR